MILPHPEPTARAARITASETIPALEQDLVQVQEQIQQVQVERLAQEQGLEQTLHGMKDIMDLTMIDKAQQDIIDVQVFPSRPLRTEDQEAENSQFPDPLFL